METILDISEVHGFKMDEGKLWQCTYDGFTITTDKQQIKLGIDNGQSCCESWGYFMTNDNIQEFVGAGLISVDIVNECLEKDKAPDLYEGGVMFVNIETTKGTLQFTAYNDHNGYYGHEAVVASDQLNHSETL
jgi:hypothetical protein